MSDDLRPGAPIDVLQTWTDPPEWWPACVRKTAELAEGGSLRPLLAGEAFGPTGGVSAFAVYVDDEGKSWRRRAGTLPFTLATDSGLEIGVGRPTGDHEASDRLAAVADELGCDPGAAIFHARAAVHDRDRWAGIVKKRELTLERLAAILSGKIDPVLLENDKLKSRCADQHEALMDIAWSVSELLDSEDEREAIRTPSPRQVVDQVRRALELLKRLLSGIRDHRDQKGHDRCWLDDQELYALLPEGAAPSCEMPGRAEFLAGCERYYELRLSRPKNEADAIARRFNHDGVDGEQRSDGVRIAGGD